MLKLCSSNIHSNTMTEVYYAVRIDSKLTILQRLNTSMDLIILALENQQHPDIPVSREVLLDTLYKSIPEATVRIALRQHFVTAWQKSSSVGNVDLYVDGEVHTMPIGNAAEFYLSVVGNMHAMFSFHPRTRKFILDDLSSLLNWA